MNYKLLRYINYVSITITFVLTIFFFINLLGNSLYRNDVRFSLILPSLITQPILVFISLIISIKTNQQKGNMIFALFLSLLSDDRVLQYLRMMNHNWAPDALILTISILTGTVFIKVFQSFPRQITKEDVKSVFPKGKILSGYVTQSAKNNTWFIFPVILLGVALIVSLDLMNVFILITASIALYVNFKKSSQSEKDKILWIFWGVLTYTFLVIIHLLINYFNPESSNTITLLISMLKNFVLVCSLLMSLFFSNAFDTGVLIRRTLVDSFIFIMIVLIYNTMEHYFLHWLSHELEISDALLSSLLSGIFVLAFNPLHHKFMNYMGKKVKKHPDGKTERRDYLDSINPDF